MRTRTSDSCDFQLTIHVVHLFWKGLVFRSFACENCLLEVCNVLCLGSVSKSVSFAFKILEQGNHFFGRVSPVGLWYNQEQREEFEILWGVRLWKSANMKAKQLLSKWGYSGWSSYRAFGGGAGTYSEVPFNCQIQYHVDYCNIIEWIRVGAHEKVNYLLY